MPKILITNDDSYLSKGLYLLYEAVKDLGEVRIYSTELPRSAVSHAITFNKPVRIAKKKFLGYEVYVTDGSPIDALYLAIYLHRFKPDLVLSGVNVGENLTLQHVFYSGTLAVAIEAALSNIPAVAFSADIQWFEDFDHPVIQVVIKRIAKILASHILSHGLPPGVDLLSINIPPPHKIKPCVRVARAARRRWEPVYVEHRDTRGRPYYWLAMNQLAAEEGTDVYHHMEGCITITPLNIDLNAMNKISENELEELRVLLERDVRAHIKPSIPLQ